MYVAKATTSGGGKGGVFETGVPKEMFEAVMRSRGGRWRMRRSIVGVLPTGDEVRTDPETGEWSVFTVAVEDASEGGAVIYKERRAKSRALPLYCFGEYLDEHLLEEAQAGPLRLSRRVYADGAEFYEVAATARRREVALVALDDALRVSSSVVV